MVEAVMNVYFLHLGNDMPLNYIENTTIKRNDNNLGP